MIVKNLENEGLLTRNQDQSDKRKFILHITAKGISLMDMVYPENEKMIIDMMSVWDDEEQLNLINYMRKFGGLENGKKD